MSQTRVVHGGQLCPLSLLFYLGGHVVLLGAEPFTAIALVIPYPYVPLHEALYNPVLGPVAVRAAGASVLGHFHSAIPGALRCPLLVLPLRIRGIGNSHCSGLSSW